MDHETAAELVHERRFGDMQPFFGLALIGLGVLGLLGRLAFGRGRGITGFVWLALSSALIAAGFSVTAMGAGSFVSARKQRMEVAEAAISSSLERLDPIARAKVLKDVAQRQAAHLGMGAALS